jgi:hypothetical protein
MNANLTSDERRLLRAANPNHIMVETASALAMGEAFLDGMT